MKDYEPGFFVKHYLKDLKLRKKNLNLKIVGKKLRRLIKSYKIMVMVIKEHKLIEYYLHMGHKGGFLPILELDFKEGHLKIFLLGVGISTIEHAL